MTETLSLVFSYGTLKRGFRNHYNMERDGIKYFKRCHTLEKYPMYCDTENRNRPCLAKYPGHGYRVFGELFEVTRDALAYLDDFERVPTHYTRELCAVKGEDGQFYEAFVFFNNTDESRLRDLLYGNEKFTLIPNYTREWHALYVPRTGNTGALSIQIHEEKHPLHATLDALDLHAQRLFEDARGGAFSGGVVVDYIAEKGRLDFSVCYCGCCSSSFYSSLVDALTLAILCHSAGGPSPADVEEAGGLPRLESGRLQEKYQKTKKTLKTCSSRQQLNPLSPPQPLKGSSSRQLLQTPSSQAPRPSSNSPAREECQRRGWLVQENGSEVSGSFRENGNENGHVEGQEEVLQVDVGEGGEGENRMPLSPAERRDRAETFCL
mmetsp:Transcript_54184/g.106011  ORF Transcript_54184/g.106011 Transcript_54184/m.106011 type:complete len:379 (-) Transcript_54184:572-1708(-)